jgi:hypothetical protein
MEGGIMADLRASGLGGVPKGATADRPASPSIGDVFYNGTLGCLEIYTSQGWVASSAPPAIPESVVATNQGSGRAFNNGQASVAFSAGSNGGISSDYEVTPSPATSPSSFTGSSSPIIVTGLQSSTQYTYTVKSRNNFGTSVASSASSAVTSTTVPQAPTIGTATGGDTSVSLTFTAGATGGSAITNYKYSIDGTTYTALSPAQTSSPLTISGLTNGQSYSFYLKAVNANGDSAASAASNSATPLGSFEIMVVAGGGGTTSGGGGAGGFRVLTNQVLSSGTTYTATVGGGGAGGTGPGGSNAHVGSNSSFSGSGLTTITSSGGGRGGPINADEAMSGGSGGGGGRASVGEWSNKAGNAGGYTPAEGNQGGKNRGADPYNGGGGGGAGGAGENATTTTTANAGAKGGVGNSSYSSWGAATSSGENVDGIYYYAGGGGSGGDGGNSPRGLGGDGGGGDGAYNGIGSSGMSNTGGGGGGGGNAAGGSGGSGIIIIRRSGSYTAAATTNSPTRYESGGYTYYKFNSTGTITI